MCGIIAVVRQPSSRTPPGREDIVPPLEEAEALLSRPGAALDRDTLSAAARLVASADELLRGVPGVTALVGDRTLLVAVEQHARALADRVAGLEAELDALDADSLELHSDGDLELVNASLIELKDAVWAIGRDRLRTARAVGEFTGGGTGPGPIGVYTSVQQALSALDRLEVRGRDSAGLHVLVRGHGLDLDSPAVAAAVALRSADPLFASLAVRVADGALGFVYKAAAEIGELGDNTRALRAAIAGDDLLRQAVEADGAEAVVLAHTRWASVGIISQPNAHPLNSEELDRSRGPYVTAVLNGDVDNFADLKATEALRIAAEITTDAKVIPTLASRQLAQGVAPMEALRRTVDVLEGSVAIAVGASALPGDLFLALRGSGQALYVGLAEDAFLVASEPYGLVEDTSSYLRMDGETPADPANPSATRGQILWLRGAGAGDLGAIERIAYDGTPLPITPDEVVEAQITTRDIDRGDAPHYLLKEISEAPASFRKTLRGKLIERDGALSVVLPSDTLPDSIRADLRSGSIRHVLVIGQGTAAVAGQSLAATLTAALGDGLLQARAMPATELSGFELRPTMTDTLVVAISQSGTTTDTNRTVDLVRSRGGRVIAIVNRRNSDLTDKADGVLYTSDGRDVEMSVASTKAFYAQIAAGNLLALAIAAEVGIDPAYPLADVLRSLRELPDLMTRTLACRPALAEAAQQFAPSRRYWAIVGNGPNRIAAQEVRIKLSELCYKSIACDATEDKKHIDLSAEPMILVCAAGLTGSTADDVAKEIAIYRAHKAAPIVIASEGEERFSAALAAILVPVTHPSLAFILSAMVGHLFGYEAALAIDALARPLREARAAIESVVSDLSAPSGVSSASSNGGDLLDRLSGRLEVPAGRFFDDLRSSDYDGQLEASTAVRLASQFRYALGVVPLEGYQLEHGKVGTPSVVIEDLTASLTRA
ncbi:MAG TPA: SIS domain-containing protein, partial [Acidimicrobiales bacterium]